MRTSDFEEYLQAYDHFFPEGIRYTNDVQFLRWRNRNEFVEDVKQKTGIDISSGNPVKIKDSQQKLAELLSPEATTPGKERLETLVEKDEAAKAEAKVDRKASDEKVRESITRQQAIYDEKLKRIEEAEKTIKDKDKENTVYVAKEEVDLSEDEQQVINNLREQISANPAAAAVAIEQEIRQRVDESIPDSAVSLTALNIVVNLQSDSLPTVQSKVAETVAKGTIKLGGKEVQDVASILSNQSQNLTEMSEAIAKSAFGENFAKTVFPKVEVSEAPQEGYQSISLSYMPPIARDVVETQSEFLKKDSPDVQIETKSFVERWQAEIAKGNVQGRSFNTISVQDSLARLPKGPDLTYEALGGNTKVNLSTGLHEPAGIVGGLLEVGIQKGAGKLATAAIAKTGIKKVATGVVAKTGVKAFIAGLGLAGGGPFGAAAAWFVSEVVVRLGSKILSWIQRFIARNKDKFAIGGLLLIGGGMLFGSLPLVVGGGLLSMPGLIGGTTISQIGAGMASFFSAISAATLGAIGIPILITLLAFPVVIAFILFIINSGAYVVPPSPLSFSTGQDNPYMSVTKEASPDKFGNPVGNAPITYTVTITATKSPLTNLTIVSSSCKVTKKDKSQTSCPPENIPEIPAGTTVTPGSPYSFTFTATYGQNLSDSLVFDSIEISADAPEESGITTSGSETVCIGDCPTSCMKVVDNGQTWPNGLRANVESAATTISSRFQDFAAEVCGAGEINICYDPSQIDPGYFAWHKHSSSCDVVFNQKGVGNQGDALFLLTHEVTHHVQSINGISISRYKASGGYAEVQNSGFCTYSDTKGSITESMAEAAGLYASIPSWGGCVSNYKSQYPRNFSFAQGFME